MWTRRVSIQFVTTLMSVTHALVQNWKDVLLSGTFDYHQVLHKESILNVPSWLEDARRWIKQISQLLIIDLEETSFDVELFLTHRHRLPHVPNRLSEQAIMLINHRRPALLTKLCLVSTDCISLSWTCLSISKNSGRVAIQSRVDQVIHAATTEHVVLPCVIVENSVESELFIGRAW